MSEAVVAGYKGPESRSESVTLPARPEPITLKPSETAVVVVDMQNAYSTEGGYVDLAGFDIPAPRAPSPTSRRRWMRRGRRVFRSSISRTAGTRIMSRRAGRARPTGTSPMR